MSIHLFCCVVLGLDLLHLCSSLSTDPLNGATEFIACDLTNEEEFDGFIHDVVARHGQLDCLLNNAGWHPPNATIDQFSVDDCRKLMDLNFFAMFQVWCLDTVAVDLGVTGTIL